MISPLLLRKPGLDTVFQWPIMKKAGYCWCLTSEPIKAIFTTSLRLVITWGIYVLFFHMLKYGCLFWSKQTQYYREERFSYFKYRFKKNILQIPQYILLVLLYNSSLYRCFVKTVKILRLIYSINYCCYMKQAILIYNVYYTCKFAVFPLISISIILKT